MTDEHNQFDDEHTSIDDATRSHESTPPQKQPRALPRRGYEGQRRPMNPPPPPPVPPSQRQGQPPRRQPQPEPPVQPTYHQPPPPRASRPVRHSKSDSGLYLPWWSLVILVLVAGGCAVGLLLFVLENGAGLLPDQTPEIVVVTSPPRGGNAPVVADTPGAIPPSPIVVDTAVPIAIPSDTPLPGVTDGCPLNATVEVVGVGGIPLLIRSEPRQGENWIHQAVEGEQFRIIGGPQESADVNSGLPIEWCQLQGVIPANSSVTGWASRDFLAIVSE